MYVLCPPEPITPGVCEADALEGASPLDVSQWTHLTGAAAVCRRADEDRHHGQGHQRGGDAPQRGAAVAARVHRRGQPVAAGHPGAHVGHQGARERGRLFPQPGHVQVRGGPVRHSLAQQTV